VSTQLLQMGKLEQLDEAHLMGDPTSPVLEQRITFCPGTTDQSPEQVAGKPVALAVVTRATASIHQSRPSIDCHAVNGLVS